MSYMFHGMRSLLSMGSQQPNIRYITPISPLQSTRAPRSLRFFLSSSSSSSLTTSSLFSLQSLAYYHFLSSRTHQPLTPPITPTGLTFF